MAGKPIEDQVVVVTGGSRGIGAGIVTHFLGLEGKALDGPSPIAGVVDEWACARSNSPARTRGPARSRGP